MHVSMKKLHFLIIHRRQKKFFPDGHVILLIMNYDVKKQI